MKLADCDIYYTVNESLIALVILIIGFHASSFKNLTSKNVVFRIDVGFYFFFNLNYGNVRDFYSFSPNYLGNDWSLFGPTAILIFL